MSQLELILLRLSDVKTAPNDNYQANCPCPHHSKPNNGKLYLKDGGDVVLMDCKSGCTAQEILYELELQLKDLYPPTKPEDSKVWRDKLIVNALAKEKDDNAIKLYTELCVLKETIQARIFSNDKHPENMTELWDREKEAYRLLPKYFKEYYK